MSPHIIKCKTILKINERETINLTQYLNFHRHTEPGGGSMCEACGGTFQGFCFCSNCQVVALNGTGGGEVWSGPGAVRKELSVAWTGHQTSSCPRFPAASRATWKIDNPGWHLPREALGRQFVTPYLLTIEGPLGCMLCAQCLFTWDRAALLQPGLISSKGLAQCCQGCSAPNGKDTFFPPLGPAITVTCGGGFDVKANAFLMFLSLKKGGGTQNGSQQATLLNQPPRTPHHLARHLVLSSLYIWLGDISWESGSLPSTLKTKHNKQTNSLDATYQGRAWYAPFLAGIFALWFWYSSSAKSCYNLWLA